MEFDSFDQRNYVSATKWSSHRDWPGMRLSFEKSVQAALLRSGWRVSVLTNTGLDMAQAIMASRKAKKLPAIGSGSSGNSADN